MTQTNSSSDSPGPSQPAVDLPAAGLQRYLSAARRWGRVLGAVSAGLLLSCSFAPLEIDGLAWVALVPLLLCPAPPRRLHRALLGWLFGFAHFVTSLAWLNEVGFGAGVLLALICACFPMVWCVVAWAYACECCRGRIGSAQSEPAEACASPAARPCGSAAVVDVPGPLRQCASVVLLAATWVALEWVRGWIFTGFPWNQLGVTQWRRLGLLPLTTYTGVYGLSFAVVAVNIGCAHTVARWRRRRTGDSARRDRYPYALGMAVVCLIPAGWLARIAPRLGAPDGVLRVLAVQGNIPQCRQWTQEQLDLSIEVYTGLSQRVAKATRPDLIVWPETAVPAPLYWAEYQLALRGLFEQIDMPLLIGAIDLRDPPGAAASGLRPAEPSTALVFNSVFLIEPARGVTEFYDKVHRVPFGEYTPFEDLWPWLARLIGMGRSLTPGREFTVFSLPAGVRAGMNICYEDAYPRISREFVRRGANVLMTLTNDAWYAESAGSRQHMIHAVFRAVENRRPLLRSGNNSDTCLIMPDGRVIGLLDDPATGNRFVRGANVYEVPVWGNLPLTFYARHGDVFAVSCAAIGFALTAGLLACWFRRKQALFVRVTSGPGEA